MNFLEFAEQVKHAASALSISEDSARRAADRVLNILGGSAYQKDVSSAVELARDFEDYKDEEKVLGRFSLPQGPQDRIFASDVLQRMRPRVELIRQVLFGAEAAPFSSCEAAAKWISETAAEENPRKHPNFGVCSCGNLVVFSSKHRIERSRKIVMTGMIATIWSWLDYEQPTASGLQVNSVPTVMAGESKRLARLDEFARAHAPIVGCSRAALTTWVLTDIKPKIETATVRLSQTTPGKGRPSMWPIPVRQKAHLPQLPPRLSLTIEFKTADITDARLRKIRRRVKKTLNLTKKKPLTKNDEKLLRAVKQLGGVPTVHGEKKKFWSRVSERLSDQNINLSPDSVRIQHRRIRERMREKHEALQAT